MSKTKKTGSSLSEKYRTLSIKWECEEDYTPSGKGFQSVEGMFGVRPMYDGVLVGSSTFALYWCEIVAKHQLAGGVFDRFPGSELWVFQIPDHIYEAGEQHMPHLKRCLCLPMHTADAWVSWNWNPVPIHTPDDARRYLTGWRE